MKFFKIHWKKISVIAFVLVLAVFAKDSFAVADPMEPQLISVNPILGPVAGNNEVELTGIRLNDLVYVTFGGVNAQILTNNNESILVLAPPSPEGTVDVSVKTLYGESTLYQAYTYFEEFDEQACKKKKKEPVCHLPSRDEEKAMTLCLPKPAVSAHLDHGDYLGVCK